jgi:hypothetical protein
MGSPSNTALLQKANQTEIRDALQVISNLAKVVPTGIEYVKAARAIGTLLNSGIMTNLAPALPFLLRMKGRPFTLERHFPMEPMFTTKPSEETVLKCGRQVGKSTTLGAQGIIWSSMLPFFNSLYVCPRFEQTRRFSSSIVKPLLAQSPLARIMVNSNSDQSVMQKSFTNGSTQYFSFAFLDCERIRGLASDCIQYDEAQDIDPDFFPIIDEVLAASDYNRRQYSGTPKHNDNVLQVKWEMSSQGEWAIKCTGCGHWNICSAAEDLVKMVQKHGPACSKCSTLLDPATGHWEHAYAEKRLTFSGYHIPQVILPRHYAPNPLTGSMKRWADLVYAKEHSSKQNFYNEKLGESCDERVGLVTKEDLRRASTLAWPNLYTEGVRRTKRYLNIVMGVDWGGGGESDISYTTISIIGFRHDNKAELIYGERLSNVIDYTDETKIILKYFRDFNCDILAHDNAGSGSVRETLLLQAGFPANKLFPAWYTHKASTSPMVSSHPPADDRPRWYYSVDKARSLVLLCQLIKSGYIAFPKFDTWSDLADDFCALVEDKRDSRGGADVYIITRKATHGDDFAHSTNFACLAQWHSQQRYPNLADALGVK